jgi:uncharacterized Zn finger protein (UPF0148 family)
VRRSYRLYVCPRDGCPVIAMGNRGECPHHGERVVPIIVRREGVETAEQRRLRERVEKLPHDGLRDTFL